MRRIYKKLDNNQFSQNAVSHKELQSFLSNAKKDITSIDSSAQSKFKEEEENFNDLIKNWTETSQNILLILNSKEKFLFKDKHSKSLMAYGAMGAHINMALQALKATECDQ